MVAGMTRFLRGRESERGQALLAFIVLFPVFIVALFVVTDLGRYLYLKNQVRIAADSAALAAAGALDMRRAGNEVFILNETWAETRAREALVEMSEEISEDGWMRYWVSSIMVDGLEVTIIVDGTASSIFGGYLGISGFSARATSHARAAVGVNSEW
jgi:uncharacterized protein (UPF0333 family)